MGSRIAWAFCTYGAHRVDIEPIGLALQTDGIDMGFPQFPGHIE